MISRFNDRPLDLRVIFTPRSRAFLLDIVTFVFNLILMPVLIVRILFGVS